MFPWDLAILTISQGLSQLRIVPCHQLQTPTSTLKPLYRDIIADTAHSKDRLNYNISDWQYSPTPVLIMDQMLSTIFAAVTDLVNDSCSAADYITALLSYALDLLKKSIYVIITSLIGLLLITNAGYAVSIMMGRTNNTTFCCLIGRGCFGLLFYWFFIMLRLIYHVIVASLIGLGLIDLLFTGPVSCSVLSTVFHGIRA
jgi:hypothetical protein